MCKKKWIYLENIFKGPDIKKQLPTESQKFKKVDQLFKALMGKTKISPNVIKTLKLHSNLLEQLKANNELLDDIQKKLEDYLEK